MQDTPKGLNLSNSPGDRKNKEKLATKDPVQEFNVHLGNQNILLIFK